MGIKSPLLATVPPAPAKSATLVKTTTQSASTATQDEIAVRAYELFLQDGSVNGNHLEHWLRGKGIEVAQEILKSLAAGAGTEIERRLRPACRFKQSAAG